MTTLRSRPEENQDVITKLDAALQLAETLRASNNHAEVELSNMQRLTSLNMKLEMTCNKLMGERDAAINLFERTLNRLQVKPEAKPAVGPNARAVQS